MDFDKDKKRIPLARMPLGPPPSPEGARVQIRQPNHHSAVTSTISGAAEAVEAIEDHGWAMSEMGVHPIYPPWISGLCYFARHDFNHLRLKLLLQNRDCLPGGTQLSGGRRARSSQRRTPRSAQR
jgi:hypothetical protein